jgi:hypothetical protein
MYNFTFGLAEKLFKSTYRRYGSNGCRLLGFSGVTLGIALFFVAELIPSDPLAIAMRFVTTVAFLAFLIEWHAISVNPPRDWK